MMSGRRARAARAQARLLRSRDESFDSTAFSLPVFGEPDIVHFYLPLSDPIKTPHLFQYPVSYVHDWIEDDRPCFVLPSDGGVRHAARHYMLFHQVQVAPDRGPLLAAFDIMATEESRMRGVHVTKDGPPLSEEVPLTIVEVIAALDPSATDPLSDVLDEAIGSIQEFQLYYHLETNVLLRRLTRNALPPLIPVLNRSFGNPLGATPGVMIVNEGGPGALAAAAPEVSSQRLNKLLEQTRHRPADMFRTFTEMRQDARLSFLGGDYSAASLFCAISAESLLTELVLMLMWEEAKPLQEVADLFGNRDNVSKQLMTAIGTRLRGDWDRNGNGPVGRWQRDVANLRNRVAHLGTRPSEEEIQGAFDAVQGLEHFVGDRLAEGQNMTRYPQTVRTYLGDAGIAKRGRSAAWDRYAAAKIFPVHASTLFTLWKREVDRLRQEAPLADPERAVPVLVAYPNGARRWYLVDEVVDLVCQIDEPTVDPATMGNLRTAMSSTEWDVVSIRVRTAATTLPDQPVWLPSYHCLPMKSIHRWSQCLWRPPTTTVH